MMGSAGITNVGPINTPTTNTGAIAGFDPIMKWSKKKQRRERNKNLLVSSGFVDVMIPITSMAEAKLPANY